MPAAGQAADHRVRAVDSLIVADHDPRPGRREQPRAGGSDAAAGAGDDRDLAAEILADLRHACSPHLVVVASDAMPVGVLSPRSARQAQSRP